MPLPWEGSAPSYGFGPGSASWLPQPDAWAELSRAAQADDPTSMLALYGEALRQRRDRPDGDGFAWLEAPPGVLAFHRGDGFTCAANLGDDPVTWSPPTTTPTVALASDPVDPDGSLPGATAVWWRG